MNFPHKTAKKCLKSSHVTNRDKKERWGTCIDNTPGGVPYVSADGEVEQVVQGEAKLSVDVDVLGPLEAGGVPRGAFQHGPPSHLTQHILQRVQSLLLYRI